MWWLCDGEENLRTSKSKRDCCSEPAFLGTKRYDKRRMIKTNDKSQDDPSAGTVWTTMITVPSSHVSTSHSTMPGFHFASPGARTPFATSITSWSRWALNEVLWAGSNYKYVIIADTQWSVSSRPAHNNLKLIIWQKSLKWGVSVPQSYSCCVLIMLDDKLITLGEIGPC